MCFEQKTRLLGPRLRFGASGEPSPQRQFPKQTRVWASDHVLPPDSIDRASLYTRQHTYVHRAAAVAFLFLAVRPHSSTLKRIGARLVAQTPGGRFCKNQGCALAPGAARFLDPILGYLPTTLAIANRSPLAPSQKWPDAAAPPDTFRGKISSARRHRPRRRQPAHTPETPNGPKRPAISAPNTQLTPAPQRRQQQP